MKISLRLASFKLLKYSIHFHSIELRNIHNIMENSEKIIQESYTEKTVTKNLKKYLYLEKCKTSDFVLHK